jgi:succinylarginine dihydrolase
LEQVAKVAPFLLNACSSASNMWTANSATVAPSADTADAKVHFTPANLVSKLHRSLEPGFTAVVLKTVFHDRSFFSHHDPLLANEALGDEGAANHTRLTHSHGEKGLHLFVYGRSFSRGGKAPQHFPARQTREASEAVARLNHLSPAQTVFAQQLPEAIDAGVFHNDVICVGNGSVLFFHEKCFADESAALQEIQRKWDGLQKQPLTFIRVLEKDVPLKDVISSYLFNSQLVSLPSGKMALVAPSECETTPTVKTYLSQLVAQGGPIAEVHTPDLRQSMRNGGGPACLRLRVALTEKELRACSGKIFIDDILQAQLETWVKRHYRDRLSPSDLADPKLLLESRTALDELTQILQLGSVYGFQQTPQA